MNQVDQNINKVMIDSELIDVDSLDFGDDQTWLSTVLDDSGQKVDIVDWNLSCDYLNEDEDYLLMEKELNQLLDKIIKNNHDIISLPDRQKFDSRTYVRPKKKIQRPSIQAIVESNPPSLTPNTSLQPSLHPGSKYLTYNKYNNPLGAISPMLRLKTFNVDTNSDNSAAAREFAMKRRSLIPDDDPQLEDADITLQSSSEVSGRLSEISAISMEGSGRISLEHSGRPSMEHPPSKPINIDLSQPAHNLHNTFNKGLTNMLNERGSLNMYQSGESLMRMSPPSLVSSLLMENSGQFNSESLEGRRSITLHKDSGIPPPGRDSIDPMMTSMTLSILDEKDMSTSFLSQTTYPDHDSLIDSLPPSLVSSLNSSYVVNTSKPKDEPNIFSSATFTHLEQSERLLSARPRCQMFGSFRRESTIRNSETKSREEACQIDTTKVLNENIVKKEPEPLEEPITLHFANNKFITDAEKENFQRDDAFYKDMGMQKPDEINRNSLNVTLGKQELNEIIQARQKLSLARKALPTEDKLPNQTETPVKTIILPNATITVPKQSMDNASELLSRRRANGMDKEEPATRETPKRNATFKKISPRSNAMDATVVYMNEELPANDIIDINSATLNLIDGERTLQQEEWGSQERAMVGSSESTDTGTFSSSSPPESVPDTAAQLDPHSRISSTPLMALRKGAKNDLLNLHTTISPIYDMIDDKSYTVTKAPSISPMERTYDMHNTTVINSATMKKTSVKRDILAPRDSPERKPSEMRLKSPPSRMPTTTVSHGSMAPPAGLPRKSSLPTSKLRQYSSHRELNRIPAAAPPIAALRGVPANRTMLRRNVYASNPALSPTASKPLESYIFSTETNVNLQEKVARPVLTNPPPLVRQGTETLRRERPQSQLIAPKDPPVSRPYSIAGGSQLRVNALNRPASTPSKPVPAVPVVEQPRPSSSNEPRLSGLPRPSRLPAPRRALRPPSVYSVAPAGDADNY